MASLRERISAAAQELYLQEGLDGLSMRRVADRVGISATAIYRHFQDKEELLEEIITEGVKILEGYLQPALEADTPNERLSRLIERYLDFALEQPKYFDFAFLIPSRTMKRLPEELARQGSATFRLAVEQVAQCMEQGIFAPADPFQASITLWASAHGLVSLYRTGRFGLDETQFRAIYRDSVSRLLEGLKPPGTAA